MYYIVNDSKDQKSSKIKKKSVEEILMLLFRWALYIENPLDLNICALMYFALRWKPNLRNLNRMDTNAVLLQVFRNKQYASTGIFSFMDLLTIFDEKTTVLIKQEKLAKCYNNHELDEMIRDVVLLMRKDLKEAQLIIAGLQRRKSISTTALYFIINHTAKEALKNRVKWVNYLTMNSMIDDLAYRGDIPIEEWLVNSEMGFDEEAYKKDLEREKDRKLNHNVNRHAANHLQTIANMRSQSTNPKPKGKKKGNNGASFNAIIKEVTDFLHKRCPNVN